MTIFAVPSKIEGNEKKAQERKCEETTRIKSPFQTVIHSNHLAIDCSAKTSPVFFYPGILCKIFIVDDEIHCRVVPGQMYRDVPSLMFRCRLGCLKKKLQEPIPGQMYRDIPSLMFRCRLGYLKKMQERKKCLKKLRTKNIIEKKNLNLLLERICDLF